MLHQAPEVAHLDVELRELEADRDRETRAFRKTEEAMLAREAEIEKRIDAANLAAKPAYPTQGHIEGIAKLAELIHSDDDFGGRYGDSVDERGFVRFSSVHQRADIHTLAPYRRHGQFTQLWAFTPAEAKEIHKLFKANHLRALHESIHDAGFSVILTSTKV